MRAVRVRRADIPTQASFQTPARVVSISSAARFCRWPVVAALLPLARAARTPPLPATPRTRETCAPPRASTSQRFLRPSFLPKTRVQSPKSRQRILVLGFWSLGLGFWSLNLIQDKGLGSEALPNQ